MKAEPLKKDWSNMSFDRSLGGSIADDKLVTMVKTNHIIEVQSVLKPGSGSLKDLKKLNKDEYMNLKTGEVLEYQKSDHRGQNIAGLKKTFKNLRLLINNNFIGEVGEKHIILTYKENMTDTKRLYSDFDKFIKRFRYKYPGTEYICVVEPQGRGAWHCHLLLKTSEEFIPNEKIAALWKQGFTKTLPLENIDNIGAYLSAYLTDIEIDIEESNFDFENESDNIKIIEGKKYLKGGRMYLYPPGMKLFRSSKGIVKPEKIKIKYEDIKKITRCAKPDYSMTLTISADDEHINTVVYQQYNLKRLENQEG
jgi:hypothetical protein